MLGSPGSALIQFFHQNEFVLEEQCHLGQASAGAGIERRCKFTVITLSLHFCWSLESVSFFLFSPGVIALGFLSWFGIIFLRMFSFGSRLDVDILLLFSLVLCSPSFSMAAGGACRWKWPLHGECCVTFSCRIQGSTNWLFVLSTKWIAAFNIMIPLGFLGLFGPDGWKDSRTDFSHSPSVEDNLSMSKGHLSKLRADDAVQTHRNYSTCNATTQQKKKLLSHLKKNIRLAFCFFFYCFDDCFSPLRCPCMLSVVLASDLDKGMLSLEKLFFLHKENKWNLTQTNTTHRLSLDM